MKKFDTRTYNVSDFVEWESRSQLELSPDFQRRSVWSQKAKSYLVDTIIRGKPIPKLLITQEIQDRRNTRIVVDGQQRLRAILEYVDGGFPISRAHSRYEEFIEQAFLLYCQGRAGLSGRTVKSYILPRNQQHAKSILKSGMNFLEWNAPEKILARCEIYLSDDSPIYLAITTHQSRLQIIRKIRNAIAHASDEADIQFRKTVRSELGVAPLRSPSVGEFLIMNDRLAPRRQYYLRSYLDVLEDVARIAAG